MNLKNATANVITVEKWGLTKHTIICLPTLKYMESNV